MAAILERLAEGAKDERETELARKAEMRQRNRARRQGASAPTSACDKEA